MKNLFFAVLLLIGFTFSACDDDNEGVDITPIVIAPEQILSQNAIRMTDIRIDEDGWVVVHEDDGNDAPVTPDIVSEPSSLPDADFYRGSVQLLPESNPADGKLYWVMLHYDTGVDDEYEFDGQSGEDPPVTRNGSPVMDQVTIRAPYVGANDQSVNNNQVIVDSVAIGSPGWVVIHLTDGQGNVGAVVGQTRINNSITEDIVVNLDDNETYTQGDELVAMLHINANPEDEFNFPTGDDVPEVFGFDQDGNGIPVIDRFTIL